MANLARPVFESGPKDPVDIVDVYQTADPEVRNNLTSKLSSFGSSLSQIYNKGMDRLAILSVDVANGRVDPEQAIERCSRALKGSRGDILSLATSAQNAILSELTGVEPGTDYVKGATELYDSVSIAIGQADRIFNSGDMASVQATLGFISDLTGNKVFDTLDLGAEAALVRGILGEVSAWGIPELIDEVLSEYNDDFRYSVVSRSSESILNTSNIDTLEAYVNQGMANALTNKVPNFAEQFIANYTFPGKITPGDYPARLTQLVNTLTALKPDWFTLRRDSTEVINLAVLSRVSPDAHRLFLSDELYRTAVLCAGNFPKENIIHLVKRNYPLIGIVRNS